MSKNLPKWKQEILEGISKMSNPELYEAVLNLASGDDYDGCFTDHGEWEFKKLTEEFELRLGKSGFFTEEQYSNILDRKTKSYSEGLDDFFKQYMNSNSKPLLINKYDPDANPDEHRQFSLGWKEASNIYNH